MVLDDRIKDAQSGDRTALGVAFRKADPLLRGQLAGAIPARLAPLMDLTDLLQVTYLEAALSIRRFNGGPREFVGWLVSIARNNIKDALRESKRKKRSSEDGVRLISLHQAAHEAVVRRMMRTSVSPSRVYAKEESKELLLRAMEKLPPDYRKVIELCDLQERAANEAAERMGRSVGAVYMLRARAHEHLASLLDSLAPSVT